MALSTSWDWQAELDREASLPASERRLDPTWLEDAVSDVDPVDVPYRDPDFLGTTKYHMTPLVETLQVTRQPQFLGMVAQDVFFEVGARLWNKIRLLTIALNEMVHLHFNDLLDVRLFDIAGSDIKADTQGADDEYAEYCECQRNAQAQAALKFEHA